MWYINRNMFKAMKILSILILVVSVLCFNIPAFAQQQQPVVTRVLVKGNKTVSTTTILSKVKTRDGVQFSQTMINEDLKTLYAMGMFTDVSVDLADYEGGTKVTFIVKERPVVDKVLIVGNKVIKSNDILKKVTTKQGNLLDRKQLKEDVEEIKKFYLKKGFTLVKVDSKVDINDETNKATVSIIIQEGQRLKIRKISIEGNKAFSDRKIRKLMRTRTAFLFLHGYLEDEVIDDDIEKIRGFYQRSGYMDAEVTKDVKYDEKTRTIELTINIKEGKKYIVGTVGMTGAQVFPKKTIADQLKMTSGKVFSPDALREDVASIQGYYFERGYIFAEIEPQTTLDEKTGKVNVEYKITENQVAYIDKVLIRGNIKTKDLVIRRELRVNPGERFDGKKLQRSKERLYNLGFFEDVNFDTEPGRTPEKKDLVVTVKESKTGSFSFGGGFSTIDKLMGFVELEQRNFDILNFPSFTGAGQDIRLRAQIGSVRQEFDLSFTEPWLFGKPIAFGFDAFHKGWERSSTSGYGYDETDTGFDVRLGKNVGEYMKIGTMYKLTRVKISNIPSNASQDFLDELGTKYTSSMMFYASRDTRDSIYSPTKGNYTLVSTEVAGGPFMGDKDFWKVIGDTDFYFSLFNKGVLETRLRAGIADKYSNTDKLPLYERFFVGGGDTVRGYEERRIGPKDPNTNDALGGKSMLVWNTEFVFPIMDFIKGAVFCDAGNVWAELDEFCSDTLRFGIGAGVRIKTPVGPVKLDYGYPLNPEKGEEKKGRFHFSITRGF